MKGLFLILGLLLSINIFSQTEANIEVIRGIVGDNSTFDTTSNPVIKYITSFMNKNNCLCYPKYDENKLKNLDYTTDFFEINDLGEKEIAYFYTTYITDTSKSDSDFLGHVLDNIDFDFQKKYVKENIDYYNLNGVENFNFLVFNLEIPTEHTYFDIDVFDDVTKCILKPYKVLLLLGYND